MIVRQGTAIGLAEPGCSKVAVVTVENNWGPHSAQAGVGTDGGLHVGATLVLELLGISRDPDHEEARCGGALVGFLKAHFVGMLTAMFYGFSELFWGLPRLERRNVGSPDWLRSGWADLHLFTISRRIRCRLQDPAHRTHRGGNPRRAGCPHRTDDPT